MKGRVLIGVLVTAMLFGGASLGLLVVGHAADAGNSPKINLGLTQAVIAAVPAPADDAMLDANGSPVLDATGKPMSDPAEKFHKVIPFIYDPAHTHLVQSTWLDGTGCPNGAKVANYPSTTPTGSYTDPACSLADTSDTHNEGLLLVKTGPTNNNAAAGATLKKVRGITLSSVMTSGRRVVSSTRRARTAEPVLRDLTSQPIKPSTSSGAILPRLTHKLQAMRGSDCDGVAVSRLWVTACRLAGRWLLVLRTTR
jgi:hypothetical protein